MTQEEFIEVLDDNGYSYEMEGNKIVVTNEDTVYLNTLTSLPPGVEFKNRGLVSLVSLETLPPGVVFENMGSVWLESLTSLPPGVEFRNGKGVNLNSLTRGWFEDWKGNIEGVDSKRLLNFMIKQGVFI
jgi:hypothetical protein